MPRRFFAAVGKKPTRKDGIICIMRGTINDDKTIAGGGEDTFFAGRLYDEAAKGTKGTEATKETDRAFKSLPSLTSLEGGANG